MFDNFSYENNIWFFDDNLNYERWEHIGGDNNWDSSVSRSSINTSSSEFKTQFEIMWNKINTNNSCLWHVSNVNQNEGHMNKGTSFNYESNFSDWYIPSLTELNHVYWATKNTNLNNNLSKNNHKPLSEDAYWTSTSADRWYVTPSANTRPTNNKFTWDWDSFNGHDGNGGPSEHHTGTLDDILNGLSDNDPNIDKDEIIRKSGNAHRMACQIFNGYPDPVINHHLCGYDDGSLCEGMTITPFRDEELASLRLVRRILVYSADTDSWINDHSPGDVSIARKTYNKEPNWENKNDSDDGMKGCLNS